MTCVDELCVTVGITGGPIAACAERGLVLTKPACIVDVPRTVIWRNRNGGRMSQLIDRTVTSNSTSSPRCHRRRDVPARVDDARQGDGRAGRADRRPRRLLPGRPPDHLRRARQALRAQPPDRRRHPPRGADQAATARGSRRRPVPGRRSSTPSRRPRTARTTPASSAKNRCCGSSSPRSNDILRDAYAPHEQADARARQGREAHLRHRREESRQAMRPDGGCAPRSLRDDRRPRPTRA